MPEVRMPPRDQPSNGQAPGVNPPPVTVNGDGDYAPISVGPDASDGWGNDQVTTFTGAPFPASPWSGWPDGWQTPAWNSGDGWLSAWGRLCDVVFAALDLNASIVSSLAPFLLHDGDRQGGRTWLGNPEPQVYPAWPAFVKEAVWSFVGCGEVFVVATETLADGYPNRFMVVSPAYVQVDRDPAGRIDYRIAGQSVDPADVLHVKYVSWPGDLRGHGPLEVAGARLLTISALSRYATNLAGSGSIPPAVIKYPRRASRAQMQQMQADWIAARSSSLGIPAVLADGAEFDVLNPQLRDAALADLSMFSEARVATLLGVPPFLLGLTTGASDTYVNSTNIFDFHWRARLRPLVATLFAALSEWLLPRGWTVELDADDYVKPGFFERAQGWSMYVAMGAVSPQFVAITERFDTRPGDADEQTPGADSEADVADLEVPGGNGGRPTQTNTAAAPTEAMQP